MMTNTLTAIRSLSKMKPDVKKHGRKLFWAWIAYQTIKGTLTTSLIWVPMIWALWGQ